MLSRTMKALTCDFFYMYKVINVNVELLSVSPLIFATSFVFANLRHSYANSRGCTLVLHSQSDHSL